MVRLTNPKPNEEALVFVIESLELKGKTAIVKPPAQVLVEVDVPGEFEVRTIDIALHGRCNGTCENCGRRETHA